MADLVDAGNSLIMVRMESDVVPKNGSFDELGLE